ncbi:TPA: hypothetical protein DEB72_00100 [Patescibacteria group bacterium]|nr:hypothetical protein [Patescibacteria group bacterium]
MRKLGPLYFLGFTSTIMFALIGVWATISGVGKMFDAEAQLDSLQQVAMQQGWNEEQEVKYLYVVRDYALPFREVEEEYAEANISEFEYVMSFGYNPEYAHPSIAEIQAKWEKKQWREYVDLLGSAYNALRYAREKEGQLNQVLRNHGYDRVAMNAWLAKAELKNGDVVGYIADRLAELQNK